MTAAHKYFIYTYGKLLFSQHKTSTHIQTDQNMLA